MLHRVGFLMASLPRGVVNGPGSLHFLLYRGSGAGGVLEHVARRRSGGGRARFVPNIRWWGGLAAVASRMAGVALLGTLVLATVGCGGDEVAPAEMPSAAGDSPLSEQDHFAMALDFLKMRDEHNLDRSANQAGYHFNRWLREQTADPRWLIDRRMIDTLPHAITRVGNRSILSDEALAKLEFDRRDVRYVEQARWLRATAGLVERTQADPDSRRRVAGMGLSVKKARQLATCCAIFDWTVRNIQLDKLLDYPKSAAAGPSTNPREANAKVNWPPPMRAIPGPGYTGSPWHVLLYGHGDAYQRARVLILLLRQLRIDAVMLGIDTKVGRARPWLPAVYVEGELYLFDPALGLPVPGPQGEGIATLSQLLDDPQLLSALDIGAKYTYPVDAADLNNVVALIDASPRALSQRMGLVEQELGAADQMILTVSPSELIRQLKECRGISAVRLWVVPVETCMYDQAYSRLLAEDSKARRKEFREHGIFRQLSPLVRGRRRFLLGQFNDRDDQEGAVSYLRTARVTDDALEKLKSSRRVQRELGLKKPQGMSTLDWQYRLDELKRMQIQAKQHAGYWMGLLHQQQENHEIAINWLKNRSLEKSPDGPWANGARYNLARCHEALGHIDQALKLYRIDESPQRHGNLLRALHLEQRVGD